MKKELKKITLKIVFGAIALTCLSVTMLDNVFATSNLEVENIYAQLPVTKKDAVLSDVKISFNGATPVTIQAYNIGGFNYVRIREILQPLDMEVEPIPGGERGVKITPEAPMTERMKLPKITNKNIKAEVTTARLIYGGNEINASCFLYNDSNYFKLADLDVVSKLYIADYTKLATQNAKDPKFVKNKYNVMVRNGATVVWNESTRTISVNKVKHDLIALFDSIRNGTSTGTTTEPTTTTQPTTGTGKRIVTKKKMIQGNEYDVTTDQNSPIPYETPIINIKLLPDDVKGKVYVAFDTSHSFQYWEYQYTRPVKATKPEVGTIPAKISIDGSQNNFYPYYISTAYHSSGGCEWYAEGRFWEVNGIPVAHFKKDRVNDFVVSRYFLDNASAYKEFSVFRDTNDVKENSISIRISSDNKFSHAEYIEYVERDSNGKPTFVYVSDANVGNDTLSYQHGKDGLVRKFSFAEFKVKGKMNYIGCFTPNADFFK